MQSRPEAIIGRYTLFGQLAAGGQASVFLGRVTGPAGFIRAVAVKRVRADRNRDERARAMMLDEARLASRVQHPNVVQTLDVVWHEGELVLVMELVQGESLARLVRSANGTIGIPVPVAVSVMAQALRGLHAAHEATDSEGQPLELVHRDLSPQNIIVDVHGVAKVLDFGVAKALGRSQDTTDVGVVKGKPSYMAPEQVHGSADRRADLWAMGVVLWECLAGAKLFTGQTDGEVLGKMLSLPIPSLRGMGRPVTAALEAVVMRALSRDLGARYATADEMADALEQLGPATSQQVARWVTDTAGESIDKTKQAVRQMESNTTASVIEAVDLQSLDTNNSRPRSKRVLALAIAASVVMVTGLVIGAWRVGAQRPVDAGPERPPTVVVIAEPADAGVAVAAKLPVEPETPPEVIEPAVVEPLPDEVKRPPKTRPEVRPTTVRPKPKPDCAVPYTMVNGVKQWRPECFGP